MTIEYRPARDGQPPVEIHWSTRRRRTVSAAARDGTVVVRLPALMASEAAEPIIERLVRRVTGTARAAARGGNDALSARANRLADRYVDGVRPVAVEWSTRMQRQYGSCTTVAGTIRISVELAAAPDAVLDHVLIHELAHLRHPDHGAAFHAIVARHEHAQWARGWLAGHTAGRLAAATAPPVGRADVPAGPA